MRTNTKIAILTIIKDENRERKPGYFWATPSFVKDLLKQRYSQFFVSETVSRYLKELVKDGYIIGPPTASAPSSAGRHRKPSNLKLTDKGLEFLSLCKLEQKIHF